MKLKFECPHCNCRKLLEVMADVTVTSEVAEIETSGTDSVLLTYGEQTNEDGEVVGYLCGGCGRMIAHDGFELRRVLDELQQSSGSARQSTSP